MGAQLRSSYSSFSFPKVTHPHTHTQRFSCRRCSYIKKTWYGMPYIGRRCQYRKCMRQGELWLHVVNSRNDVQKACFSIRGPVGDCKLLLTYANSHGKIVIGGNFNSQIINIPIFVQIPQTMLQQICSLKSRLVLTWFKLFPNLRGSQIA